MSKPAAATITPLLDASVAASVGSRRWPIVILLSVGAIIAFCSRTNISAALAYQPFIQHFQLSNIDRGVLNSAFFWSYMLLQIPTGWLVDRYGVKTPYAISFVIWCLASAATGLTSSVTGLTLTRVVTGAGEAIVTPASFRWMRQHFSENESGLAIGVYMLGTKIGPAIGAPIAAWLITLYDWHLMFLIVGLTGLVWLIPWLLMVKADGPAVTRNQPKVQQKALSLGNIMSSPVVWGSIIINFCYNYFVFYCMTWMPAYFVEQRHISLTKMGLFSFFSFAGIAIVALLAGWAADVLIKRGGNPVRVRKVFVICGFAIASTELIGAHSDSVQAALFWAIVSLSGLGLTTANSLALCRMTLIPKQAVGLVTGVQNVSTSLAGIVGPIFSGWLLQVSGGYQAPMLAIFFFLLLGGLSTALLLRPEWSPKVT